MPRVGNLASSMKDPLLSANYFEAMPDKIELYLYLLELESALDLRLVALGAIDVNGRFSFDSLEHSVAGLSGLAERGEPGRHLPKGHGPDKHSEDSGDHLSLRCWFWFDLPKTRTRRVPRNYLFLKSILEKASSIRKIISYAEGPGGSSKS